MPQAITPLHTFLTLIALGILVGLGWQLVGLAIVWPGRTRQHDIAAILCILLLLAAWIL